MRWDRHGIRPSLGKSLLFEVVDVLCPGPGSAKGIVPRALRDQNCLSPRGDLQTVTSKALPHKSFLLFVSSE